MPNVVTASAIALPAFEPVSPSPHGATRRSIIGLLAATAAITWPVATFAAPAPSTLDADLFRLIDAARAAWARARALRDAYYAAEESADPGEPPTALTRRLEDERGIFASRGTRVGELFLSSDVDNIRFLLEQNQERVTTEFGRRFVGRASEIVKVWDEWEEAHERAKEAAGFSQAEARAFAADDALDEILNRIAATPARTPAGVVAKLAIAAPLLAPNPDEPFNEQVETLVRSAFADATRPAAVRGQEVEAA